MTVKLPSRDESSYDPTEEGKVLRLSKSSYMTYRMCPRQYHWRYVVMKDIRTPATEEMIRGSDIHEAYDDMWNKDPDDIRGGLPTGTEHDFVYDVIADIEEQRKDLWGDCFKPIANEQRIEVWDSEHDVLLVGIMDGLLLHPEGGLCILELKTGGMNGGKLSRTRQELHYYERLLKLSGETRPITHFAYLAPDCENPDFVTKVMNTRGKEVILGDMQGVLIIEPVTNRSRNTFEKHLSNTIASIKAHEWPLKWSDYFCPQWCDFHLSCEEIITGGEWV